MTEFLSGGWPENGCLRWLTRLSNQRLT